MNLKKTDLAYDLFMIAMLIIAGAWLLATKTDIDKSCIEQAKKALTENCGICFGLNQQYDQNGNPIININIKKGKTNVQS